MSTTTTTTTSTTKTVLVTGATRGIGLKFVELYAQRGWNVIGAARDLNNAEKLKALSPYKIVQLDAGDEESILRAAKELEGEPIDLLINNAGIHIHGKFAAATKADLVKHFEVNSIGPFLISRAFVPNLKAAVAARSAASIAQISSLLGSIEFIRSHHHIEAVASWMNYGYLTSKAALNMFNATLALDIKQDGIAAFVFHPGVVATDMNGYTADAISADESVGTIMDTLSKLSLDDTGNFFNYDGAVLPW